MTNEELLDALLEEVNTECEKFRSEVSDHVFTRSVIDRQAEAFIRGQLSFALKITEMIEKQKIKEQTPDICDFTKCREGLHPFISITKSRVEFGEKVVRWCPQCGAIVVDNDYDNRTDPGYYRKLQYPNITKKHGLK